MHGSGLTLPSRTARRGGFAAGALLLALATSCATIEEPRSRIYVPLDAGEPARVFVTANALREAVEEALREQGIAVVPELASATLLLRAKLGNPRRGGTCGSIRNVAFDLRGKHRRVAVIKARGWVAPCKGGREDVLRKMAEELARLLPTG